MIQSMALRRFARRSRRERPGIERDSSGRSSGLGAGFLPLAKFLPAPSLRYPDMADPLPTRRSCISAWSVIDVRVGPVIAALYISLPCIIYTY